MTGKRTVEARRWFQQATYDLKAAHWNVEGKFCDTACFLAQQAGEKALKSLLYYLGARRTALLTHSLVEMVLESQKKGAISADLLGPARELDLHYIPSRYPSGLPSGYPHQFYDRETAESALRAAEALSPPSNTTMNPRANPIFSGRTRHHRKGRRMGNAPRYRARALRRDRWTLRRESVAGRFMPART
jgi:HEPN domain-containing protein